MLHTELSFGRSQLNDLRSSCSFPLPQTICILCHQYTKDIWMHENDFGAEEVSTENVGENGLLEVINMKGH